MYFDYHKKAQSLIAGGHLQKYIFVKDWRGISPALVLFFDNHMPMPIRQKRWEQYASILNIKLNDIKFIDF